MDKNDFLIHTFITEREREKKDKDKENVEELYCNSDTTKLKVSHGYLIILGLLIFIGTMNLWRR